MTIHSAKGLEFDHVYLPGLEEGLFPSYQSIGEQAELEEERRLCYVAITRARKKLCVTYVKNRLMYGQTQYNQSSRFLEELPEERCIREELYRREPTISGFEFNQRRSAISTFAREIKRPVASSKPAVSTQKLSVGDEVKHVKFGHGIILCVTDMSGDYLYEVMFDNFGTKKLMATFAKLTKI